MITIHDIWKRMDGVEILRGASLEVPAGQFVALIGGSGGGKSLLLRHVVRLEKPDSGEVRIDGRNLAELPGRELEALRGRIGYVFQHGALFDSETVYENVAFPLREKTRMKESQIRRRVMEELEAVGLAGAESKFPAQLSGGMLKRAALARTLVRDPEIILFDEPTTGLDPLVVRSMLDLFERVHRERKLTGILVSHELPGIFRIVEAAALLHHGRIVAFEPVEKLRENPLIDRFLRGEPLEESSEVIP